MHLDYAVADGQSESCASLISPGGKKRLEESVLVFGRNALPRIGETQFDFLAVHSCRDRQVSTFGHRVLGVEHQIDEYLLQLTDVTQQRRQIFWNLDFNLDGLGVELVLDEGDGLLNGLI